MTPEIEKQLLEWGGERLATCVSFRCVYFYDNGVATYGESCCLYLRPWKTLDDIKQTLDVFGVKLKKAGRWKVNGCRVEVAIVHGNTRSAEFRINQETPDHEAAAEYAAWKNSQEEK